MSYAQQLMALIECALQELGQEQKSGKLANTPVSNTNFLLRWITKSIKQQRFSKLMAKDLLAWQKEGRSQGSKTQLHQRFVTLNEFYRLYFPQDSEPAAVKDKQIEQLMDVMEELGWSVSNEYDLTESSKSQLFTEGESSFVLCADQCESCFDGGEDLVRPMSFYVRGDHAQFIKHATHCGLMLHKQTDYKSKVKYHGEYLIYPANQGQQLAEIPFGFNVEDYR